jgi:hypothetical protein
MITAVFSVPKLNLEKHDARIFIILNKADDKVNRRSLDRV